MVLKGILYASLACLLWGSSYVTPCFALTFSVSEVLLGRYLVFGLFCLFQITRKAKRLETELKHLPPLKSMITLALFGFLFYDLVGIINVRFNGSEAVGLVYGVTLLFSPIFINIFIQKKCPSRFDFLNVFFPLVGLLILEWEAAVVFFDDVNWVVGSAIAILQTILWIYFTRKMTSFTKLLSDPENSAANVILVIGVMCLLLSLVGWSYYIFVTASSPLDYIRLHPAADWGRFLMASLLSGLGTTWLATHLWCIASLRLPYQILASLLLADVAAAKVYELIMSGGSFSYMHALGICVLFSSGIVMKITGVYYREDPCLAELDLVPAANNDLTILPKPIIEIQMASSEA